MSTSNQIPYFGNFSVPFGSVRVDNLAKGKPVSFTDQIDLVFGTFTADDISTLGGDDIIVSLFGDDRILGGNGEDGVVAGDGNDFVSGGGDNDLIFGDDPFDVDPNISTGNDTLFGGEGTDTIGGGAGNDLIDGGSGEDFLIGGAGNDTIYAGDGVDSIITGFGDDTIYAGDGDDRVLAGDGDDQVFGEAGDDLLNAGAGDDTLNGGTGNDFIFGDTGNDIVKGGFGDDGVVGGVGNDLVLGEEGNDILVGVDNNNPAAGFGKGDVDILTGGAGEDTFVLGSIFPFGGQPAIFYNDGDVNSTGEADYALITDFELATSITKSGKGDRIQLVGSPKDYVLEQSPLGLPSGGAIYYTGAGKELIGIVEGISPDQLDLNDPSQFQYVTPETASVINSKQITLTIGDDLIFSSDEPEEIFGLGGNNTILSGGGDDKIVGGDENDGLIGEAGNDTIFGGSGNDLLFGDFPFYVEADAQNSGNDFIDGGAGTDTIGGGLGDDVLIGGEGGDNLFGEGGNDLIQGDAGNDNIFGGDGNDRIFPGTGDDNVLGGNGDDQITEEDGNNNILNGEAGNDTIIGGRGEDFIFGGIGNDTLIGGDGNDALVGVESFIAQFGLGRGEIDSLTGGAGSDTFSLGRILSDGTKVVFSDDGDPNSQGVEDYTLITDFEAGIDRIQLAGSANDYRLEQAPQDLPSGVGIFFTKAGSAPELIGLVQGASLDSLNLLKSTQFVFV